MLACAAAVCVLTASIHEPRYQESNAAQRSLPDAVTLKYFPLSSVHDMLPYIAQFLNSTDEPSLLARAQDPSMVSYRFEAWLFPGLSLRVIRFSLNSDGTATLVKFLLPRAVNPSAPTKPDKVDVNVSAQDAAKFLATVDTAGFWAMPTVEPPRPNPTKTEVFDGAFWVFEGVRGGAYHVVYRDNPNVGPFTELVHFLASHLANLEESQIPPGLPTRFVTNPARTSSNSSYGVLIDVQEGAVASEPFKVLLTNQKSGPISICLSCGGSIVPSGAVVPSFDVQRFERKKWGSQLWGLDVGSCNLPIKLEARQSKEFEIKLSVAGHYRLRLGYARAALPDTPGTDFCARLRSVKNVKIAKSPEFDVFPPN